MKKAKKNRDVFTDVLATRSWFEKEEPAKKKTKKDAASLLMLGGRLWAARGSSETKTEAESSDLLHVTCNAKALQPLFEVILTAARRSAAMGQWVKKVKSVHLHMFLAFPEKACNCIFQLFWS